MPCVCPHHAQCSRDVGFRFTVNLTIMHEHMTLKKCLKECKSILRWLKHYINFLSVMYNSHVHSESGTYIPGTLGMMMHDL